MSYKPKHLKLWIRPNCYFGAEWSDYYSAGVGRSRDSDTLERSNFECVLSALGGESETVIVPHESHWAVGWVEWIAIHKSNSRALEIADSIAEKLESYPVVDENHWSELEHSEICDFWESMSVRDRADYCARAGLSIFAARHKSLPPDDDGTLYELLRA